MPTRAAPGDLVVFYFSGHGSQQPDRNGDEQGGFDEVFLPYDVGKWGDNGIENALIDDELNARIERVLEKGADFFGVIDACHSATGFRDLDDLDVRQREVDPAELGVPDAAPVPRRFAFANENRSPGRGRAAFFYAAQESEVALERTPKGGEPNRILRRLHLQSAASASTSRPISPTAPCIRPSSTTSSAAI